VVTNPILVALDFSSAEEAVRMAQRLRPHVGGFKVGLELMMGPGPATVAAVAELGLPVFADAKLHDIPNTVSRAARQLGRYGARWVTVHALGSKAMMEAAVEALASVNSGAGILAITVLTSLGPDDLARTGLGNSPGKQVARLSKLAEEAGVEGVVCAVKELGDVAQAAPGLLRVTPGIRPAGSDPDDQARTAEPSAAIARGADYLVIGRPITAAPNPEEAAIAIVAGLGLG
jgi:orotidine-5'-phosphate decarboxylase